MCDSCQNKKPTNKILNSWKTIQDYDILPAPLDTSAQLEKMEQKDFELCGKVSDSKNLSKVAKRKFLTSNLALRLLYLSEAKREIEDNLDFEAEQKIIKSYRNMFYCNSEMILEPSGNLKTRFCKNRLCLICNANRTAKLIDKYDDVFKSWEDDMYLVTLTISNVNHDLLKDSIIYMNQTFNKIKDVFKKRFQKNNAEKFEGIKKFECTSLRKDDYHPHFHILVKGFDNAMNLKELWIDYINKGKHLIINKDTAEIVKEVRFYAGADGQDIRKANKDSAKELFKYFTKIISKTSKDRLVYLDRLDNIYRSIKGLRIFQSFGFKLSDYSNKKEKEVLKDVENQDNKDVMFYDNINVEQLEINKKIKNFEKYNTSINALNLIAEFAEMDIDKKMIFNILTPEQKSNLQALKVETAEDCLDFVFHQEAMKISNYESIKTVFDLADFKIDLKDEKQDKKYYFDYRIGNWIELNKGLRTNAEGLKNNNKLFNFNISSSLSDIVQSFVYPERYKDKIFELYEWKRNIKNLCIP